MPSSVSFPPSLSFAGKSVLITGGTTGLGLETAIHYVALGASPVIITARNTTRGAVAVATIEARTGKKGIVQVRSLDMDSLLNVKKFADDLKHEVKYIDIVLLNAGCFASDYNPSSDGWEQDLQVNTLSTALLALLLLPWMQAIKQPDKVQHLGIVGSGMHTKVDILSPDFPKKDVLQYFNEKQNFKGGSQMYAISKLFIHYAALEIAKLAIQPDGSPSPILNTICPGRVSTDLARSFAARSIIYRWLIAAWKAVLTVPGDVGARQLVVAGDAGSAEHGKFLRPYLTDAEYNKAASKNITNEAGQKMQALVWQEILDVLAATVPEVAEIATPKVKS